MDDKTIMPKPEVESDASNADDHIIKDFVARHEKYKANPAYLSKLTDIENDYEFLEDHAGSGDDVIRSGVFYKILRVYSTEAKGIPKIKPVDERSSPTTISIVDAVRTQIGRDANIQSMWDGVRRKFETEGVGIVQIGFDPKTGKITYDVCDFGECFFDATKSLFASGDTRIGKDHGVFIRDKVVTYGDLKVLYPDLWEQVNVGSPYSDQNRDVFDEADDTGKMDDLEITLSFCFSIVDPSNPIMTVCGGGNTFELERHEGKDYPYWITNEVGEDEPFLPFVFARGLDVMRGGFPPSVIGALVDKVRPIERMLTTSLPIIEKIVNPLLLLNSGSDQDLLEKLSHARELQAMGESHIIPSRTDASIQSIAPDSVFSEVDQARGILLRELSGVFGFNVQDLEEVEQTATETVAKSKVELKAIAGIYKITTDFWIDISRYSLALAARHWKESDTRLITAQNLRGDDVELEMSLALKEVKDFRGTFEVETDLRMPMSSQDKAAAVQEIMTMIRDTAYNTDFGSVEEMETEIAAIEFMANLRDVDHMFTRPKIAKKFELALQNKQEQAQRVAEAEQIEGEGVNDEVLQELAPQSFLAEAGLEANV